MKPSLYSILIALLVFHQTADAVPPRVFKEAAELAAGRAGSEAAEAALKRSTNELLEQEIRLALQASKSKSAITRQGSKPGVHIILAKGGTETATKHFARSWWREIVGVGAGAGIYALISEIPKIFPKYPVTFFLLAVLLMVYFAGPTRFFAWVKAPVELIRRLFTRCRQVAKGNAIARRSGSGGGKKYCATR